MTDLRAAHALVNTFPVLEKMETDVLALGSRIAPADYERFLKRIAFLRRCAMSLGVQLASKHASKQPISH